MKALMGEVGFGQLNRRIGDVDPGHDGAAPGESGQIHGRPAANLQHRLAMVSVEVHEPEQMMQFLEMILIKVLKEAARPHRMLCDLQIVDMPFPISAHFVDGCHADNNIAGAASSPSCDATLMD